MNQTRDCRMDIVKGIAITLMVIGHTAFPFKSFIYLFHMAVFFMVSGYLHNLSYSDSIQDVVKFIKKKLYTLWFPFFLGNAIYSILHNFFILINVYTNNESFLGYSDNQYCRLSQYWTIEDILINIIKGVFFAGDTQLGGAFWFLKILFGLSILYVSIGFILAKICKDYINMIQSIISILLLFIGYYLGLKNVNLFSIQIIFSCYCLFHMGVLLRYATGKYIYGMRCHLIFLVTAFGTLCILNNLGEISLGNNFYPNPLFLLIASLAGWMLLFEISYFLEKCEMIKRIFVCLGRSTLSILMLHFLCFKIVSYMGVIYENKPRYLVAAFPVLYNDKWWWCAYAFIGLVVPVLSKGLLKLCLHHLGEDTK